MNLEEIKMYFHDRCEVVTSIGDVYQTVQTMGPFPTTQLKDDTNFPNETTWRCFNYDIIDLERTTYSTTPYSWRDPKLERWIKIVDGHEAPVYRQNVIGQHFIIMDKLQSLDELQEYVISQEPKMKEWFKERHKNIRGRKELEEIDAKEPIWMFGWEKTYYHYDNQYHYSFMFEPVQKRRLIFFLHGDTIVVDRNLHQLWPNATGTQPVELLNIFRKTNGTQRLR